MAELAGRINLVNIKPKDSGSFTKINGVDDSTLNRLAEILEISQFGDTHRKRIAGIKDSDLDLSGNYDPADTNGQLLLEPGDIVLIQVLYDGTNGRQIEMIIENFEQSASADGVQEFSSSLLGNGAPTDVPA